jgi:hypothetical protein
MSLPEPIIALLASFQPVFTNPTWQKALVLLIPRDAQRAGESGEDGLSCGFEDVLLVLIRNG